MTLKERSKKTMVMSISALLALVMGSVGTFAVLKDSLTGEHALVNTFSATKATVGLIDPRNPGTLPVPKEGKDKLRDGFVLLENEVRLNERGKYELVPDAYTLKNVYDKVEPDSFLPKSAFLSVNIREGKQAYVFIKITKDSDDLTYAVRREKWEKLDGVKNLKKGEEVYLYKTKLEGTQDIEVNYAPIFDRDQVVVAADIKDLKPDVEGVQMGDIKIEAFACEAGDGTALEAFNANFVGG